MKKRRNVLICADKVAIDDGGKHPKGDWNQPGPPRTAIANHHIIDAVSTIYT